MVTAFKFRRLEYLGRHLGEALVEAVATEIDRAGPIDAVAPIPLHPWRKLRRGFDQAARIAEPAARCLGLPYAPTALRRRRATPPQSRLGRRSRLRNLERAFVPGRGARHLRDRTVLLIDDVITTGATAAAAAHGLRRAGVGRIVVAAVARAA